MDEIISPREYYYSVLKEKVEQIAAKYFDNLYQKSGISKEANNETVKKIRLKETELKKLEKSYSKYNGLRALCVFFIVLFFIVATFLIYLAIQTGQNVLMFVLISVGLILAGVGLILYICLKLNPIIRDINNIIDELKQEIKALYNLAWQQMNPLNDRFDDDMAAVVFAKTLEGTVITLDKNFDYKKYDYLCKKYSFKIESDSDSSVVLVKSGEILGNPFILYTTYEMEMYKKEYTGSLTIHWTTTVQTKDGIRTEHHTETLYAHVYEPAPTYTRVTSLAYGNQAAPHLSFSRQPARSHLLSEKQIDRRVKSTTKKLDKKARNELMDSDPTTNYTRFSHDEFETLFGGTDRDNEVEYRLLFTPLAIKNELDLIKNAEPYGDDFLFLKEKEMNTICSKHSQSFDYDKSAEYFMDYSYEQARARFIEYCAYYFRGIYFDLAPLISIPLYQQTKTLEYIYDLPFDYNFSTFEHEQLINHFDMRALSHPDTDTNTIINTRILNKDGACDIVDVMAYSFKEEPRRTYVSVYGGDGHYHDVPVDWFEYIPLENETQVEMTSVASSRQEYREVSVTQAFREYMNNYSDGDYIFRRGFIATLLSHEGVKESFNRVKSFFSNKYNNDDFMNVNTNTNTNSVSEDNYNKGSNVNQKNNTNNNISDNKEE